MPKKLRACCPGDPLQRPDWRWLRAQELAKAPNQRTDDEFVNVASDYLQRGYAGTHRIALEAALELRQPCHADPCAEIEARLLAGQSLAQAARRCCLPKEVVAVYAALFFDVVERLSARDWVMSQVLMAASADQSVFARLRNLWRRVGYFGGLLALEPLLAVSRGLRVPAKFLTAKGAGRQEQELCIRSQIQLYIVTELAITPDDWSKVTEMREALRKRFPEAVSEIPALCWMLLGGTNAMTTKALAPPATEKPTATSPTTRSTTRIAAIAALLC